MKEYRQRHQEFFNRIREKVASVGLFRRAKHIIRQPLDRIELQQVSQDVSYEEESQSDGAKYYEFPQEFLAQNLAQILRAIVPAELEIGDERTEGDLRFRFVKLPNDLTERKKIVEEIMKNGSDRPIYRGKAEFIYTAVSAGTGIPAVDIFDCYTAETIFHATGDNFQFILTNREANALLIFDAKTEYGVYRVISYEHTFKNPSQKHRALLAVIGLK